MAAPTYSSSVKIFQFTDPAQYAPKKWDVLGYKGGTLIDSVTGITTWDTMETTFGSYQKIAVATQKYDQVTVLEYTINTP